MKPVANVHSRPSEEADVVSQATYASHLRIIEEQAEWAKVRTANDYTRQRREYWCADPRYTKNHECFGTCQNATAQRKRWAAQKKQQAKAAAPAKQPSPKRRKMSPAARKRMSEATRKRWAEFRANKAKAART